MPTKTSRNGEGRAFVLESDCVRTSERSHRQSKSSWRVRGDPILVADLSGIIGMVYQGFRSEGSQPRASTRYAYCEEYPSRKMDGGYTTEWSQFDRESFFLNAFSSDFEILERSNHDDVC